MTVQRTRTAIIKEANEIQLEIEEKYGAKEIFNMENFILSKVKKEDGSFDWQLCNTILYYPDMSDAFVPLMEYMKGKGIISDNAVGNYMIFDPASGKRMNSFYFSSPDIAKACRFQVPEYQGCLILKIEPVA